MSKSRDELQQVVLGALQRFIGTDTSLQFGDKPISGLGLTSMEGAEFVTVLEDALDCSIDKTENAFKTGDGKERTVGEIVEFALSQCATAGVAAS